MQYIYQTFSALNKGRWQYIYNKMLSSTQNLLCHFWKTIQ